MLFRVRLVENFGEYKQGDVFMVYGTSGQNLDCRFIACNEKCAHFVLLSIYQCVPYN